jgi:hypothetical protein
MAPRFRVGQRVRIGKVWTRLMDYTGMRGTVTEVHRMLAEVDADGRFIRGGLVSDERDCGKGSLPSRWVGDTFEWDLPGLYGRTIRQRFHHYSYSIKVDGLAHGVQVREKDILPA